MVHEVALAITREFLTATATKFYATITHHVEHTNDDNFLAITRKKQILGIARKQRLVSKHIDMLLVDAIMSEIKHLEKSKLGLAELQAQLPMTLELCQRWPGRYSNDLMCREERLSYFKELLERVEKQHYLSMT